MGDVVRCIELLEHVGVCPAAGASVAPCARGDPCCRAKRVLLHQRHCVHRPERTAERTACAVCSQLETLCRQHSSHCMAGSGQCHLPYCHNERLELRELREKLTQGYSKREDSDRDLLSKVRELLRAAVLAPSGSEKRQRLMELLNHDPQTLFSIVRKESVNSRRIIAERKRRWNKLHCRPSDRNTPTTNLSLWFKIYAAADT